MAGISHIWVVGAGAIGSALAALLARGGRLPVTLVGSRAHWQAVRERGLLIENERPLAGPIPPAAPIPPVASRGEGSAAPPAAAGPVASPRPLDTARPADVPPLSAEDLVLLTGKLTRLVETASWLRERLAPGTAVLALQNGVGVEAWVRELLGRPAGRGLVYFGAHVPSPGRLRFYPGLLRLRAGAGAECLAEALAGSGLRCEILPDLRAQEWEKLAINCLANPLAALLGARNAEIARPALDPLKASILEEVRAVAAAEGAQVSLTVADFNGYISGPTGENIPSMAIDVRRGEPTEIEHLNGAVVRLGRARGIATPVNATLVRLIEALGPSA